MLIFAADHEQLLDMVRTLKTKVERDIGEEAVTYVEIKDAVHDVVVFPWFQPERAQILQKVTEWYRTL